MLGQWELGDLKLPLPLVGQRRERRPADRRLERVEGGPEALPALLHGGEPVELAVEFIACGLGLVLEGEQDPPDLGLDQLPALSLKPGQPSLVAPQRPTGPPGPDLWADLIQGFTELRHAFGELTLAPQQPVGLLVKPRDPVLDLDYPGPS